MHLRILIVESDPDDLLFVEEAIREIEQGGLWNPWVEVETLAASTWMETEALLPREPVDMILLNPNLSDCQGAALFRRLQDLAPHAAILLLTEAVDQNLAVQLVREGAQDFLIKKHIDCAPMAHSIRNALERQRILASVRAAIMTDPLTGLLHGAAFHALAERDRQLAERLTRRLLVIVAEPEMLWEGATTAANHQRDLALVETGDFLRGLAGNMGTLGRTREVRFALTLFDTPMDPIEHMWTRAQSSAAERRVRMGCAIFEPAEPVSLDSLLERAEAGVHDSIRAARPAAAGLWPVRT